MRLIAFNPFDCEIPFYREKKMLDSFDQKLLALLRTNARLPLVSLARKLNVSRATVSKHLQKLEDTGVIVGYQVQLRPEHMPQTISAWMSIAVEGNETKKVVSILLGEPGIVSLHITNGRWDLLAQISSTNLNELSQVMERVRLIKAISSTETSIHLETFKLS